MQTIPFSKPNIKTISQKYLDEALDVSSSLTFDFEESLKNYIGSKYAVSTINGFTAFHLGLSAIDLKRGDKVIVSVNCHPTVPESVRHFDAEPIFTDICNDDFNINLDKFEETLKNNTSKKLKGAIISFLGGQPVDLERVYKLAKQYGIFIIEDATHALGGTYRGDKIGSLYADMTIFSFSPLDRNISGNGGMIITNDEDIYEKAILLKDHAITREENYGINYIYDVKDIGFDYKLSKLNAAYCMSELEILDNTLKKRKEIANKYYSLLGDFDRIVLPKVNEEHSYYSFIIKIDKNRDGFARSLAKEGIETGLHYIPLHMLTYYKNKYNLKVNTFPEALKTYQQALCIPIYARLEDEEIEHIVSSIKKIIDGKFW